MSGISEYSAHQLPSDCYPPTDSDDDSFVVLEKSAIDSLENLTVEPYSSQPIDEALGDASNLTATSEMRSQVNLPEAHPDTLTEGNVSSRMAHFLNLTKGFSTFDIYSEINILVDENTKLKDALNQNNNAMKLQCESLAEWHHNVNKVHEDHKVQFSKLKDNIKLLQLENANLREELKRREDLKAAAATEESNLEQIAEVEQLKERIVEMEEQHKQVLATKTSDYNEVKKEMYSILAIYKHESKKYHEYLNANHGYQSQSNALSKECKQLKDELAVVTKDLQQKEEEVNTLQAEIGSLSLEDKREQMTRMGHQLQATQNQLIEMKMARDTMVQNYEKRINQLTKLVSQLENNDRFKALEDQLELYASDFATERHSKLKVIEEKNQLVDDLHNIQRRNEELLAEVENLRARCSFIEVRNEASGSAPLHQSQDKIFSCPRCNFGFTDFHALQNHVYRCIELDSLP